MSLGKFITFEGGEGVGKSTQIQKLSAYLHSLGIDHVVTREPGGTAMAERVRQLLLVQKNDEDMDSITEFLMFSAARHDHVHSLIKPALEAGKWVLCDRFYDSSHVYQGFLGQVNHELFTHVTEVVCEGVTPDRTLLFDLDPTVGLTRAQRPENLENRFEARGSVFHEKVRQMFLELATTHNERIKVIDATGDTDAVFAKTLETVKDLL